MSTTYEFRLPDIGEGVVEGEVVRWLVKEGDTLRLDQPMVEIMTDKATVEIPAPRAGRVGKRMFAEGQLCPVGKVLITIELVDEDGSVGNPSRGAAERAPTAAPRASVAPVARPAAAAPRTAAARTSPFTPAERARSLGPVLATPATRKLARELGVELRVVFGSGAAGRITSDDVRRQATSGGARPSGPPPTPPLPREPDDVAIPFRGLRRRIAENMARSKHTAAHFLYVEEVDCTELVALRDRVNARLAKTPHATGVRKVTFLPFIVKATANALRKYPQLNAALD